VARTLDPVAHAVRRDVFLDAAEQLMRTRGWDQVTVQDVLDTAAASKGAFYHYFDSKDALLEAVIERMTDAAMARVEPIVEDAGLPATAKLQAVFSTAGRWKAGRSDVLLALMRSWYADRNDLVRLRVARAGAARITPALARIVRQGADEGVFSPTSTDHAAVILVTLLNGSSDGVGRLALDRQDGRVTFGEVERFMAAYEEAIERILGLPPHSFVLVDSPSLHVWFD
jgi:AcrR family transcriptional regulator